MKLLLMIFLIANFSIQAKTLVISDIDDTLKRTNVLGYFTGGISATNPFIGLPELFNDFLCNEEPTQEAADYCRKFRGHNHSAKRSLIYVTAASGRLQLFGREFISRSNFPQVTVVGKDSGEDTLEYKTRTVKEIIQGGEYDEIILIGDNGQHDARAYKAVADFFPNKKITTYIHQVYNPYGFYKDDEKKGVELEEGQIAYFTASDLGLEFFSKGLITEKQLISISKEVSKYISSSNDELYEQVVPEWSSCKPFIANYQRPKVEVSKETAIILNSIEKRMKRLCR